jgi:UDP-glucose 4-epimerase
VNSPDDVRRVLVTGSSGRVGGGVVTELEGVGIEVRRYDAADGQDVRDTAGLTAALTECDALVHLAAIPADGIEPPLETLAHNVSSTYSALSAARAAGVRRVVCMSSIQALGVALDHREPDYLPLDDDHPSYAVRPYATSKLLTERACESFTAATGIPTICLRPPLVLRPDDRVALADRDDLTDPTWNFGAWIDVRDLATAVRCALTLPQDGHHVYLVAAEDAASEAPPRDVAGRRYPAVPVRDHPDDPYAGLIDISRAVEELGWRPQHRWRNG